MHAHVGLWLGWEGRAWKKVGGTNVLIFFLLCLQGKWGRDRFFLSTYISTWGGRMSFDNALETLIWGSEFQACYLSSFDGSEKLASLFQGWENLSKICWLTKSALVHPQGREQAAKLDQENCSTCSAFLPLTRQSMSPAGLDHLGFMSPCASRHAVHCADISSWEGQPRYIHCKVRP